MKNVDLNGQLDILRIIDPSVDIEQLRKAIIKIPKNHAIDQYTFSKVIFIKYNKYYFNIMFRYSTTLVQDEIIPRQHHLSQQHQVDRVTVPKIQIHQIFFDDQTLTQILLIW